MSVPQTTSRIAMLNDQFRIGDPRIPGLRFLTAGVIEVLKRHERTAHELVAVVSSFDSFTPDNDPHEEHNFGSLEYLGETCFWKIDYYDADYVMGSEDPTDLSRTRRVLTIMLADEW